MYTGAFYHCSILPSLLEKQHTILPTGLICSDLRHQKSGLLNRKLSIYCAAALQKPATVLVEGKLFKGHCLSGSVAMGSNSSSGGSRARLGKRGSCSGVLPLTLPGPCSCINNLHFMMEYFWALPSPLKHFPIKTSPKALWVVQVSRLFYVLQSHGKSQSPTAILSQMGIFWSQIPPIASRWHSQAFAINSGRLHMGL